MTKISKISCIFLLLAFLVSQPLAALAATTQLDRGVKYFDLVRKDSGGKKLNIHVVDVDLLDPRVELNIVMPSKGLGSTETLSSMARNNHALAGINGSYFSFGTRSIPTDTVILNGKIVTKGMRDPAAFGFTDSQVFIDSFTPHMVLTINKSFKQFNVEAVNHETGIGLIMYTSVYGTKTGTPPTSLEYLVKTIDGRDMVQAVYEGNSPIPEDGYVLSFQGTTGNIARDIEIGDEVSVNTYFPDSYKNIKELLACGPLLLKKGRILPPDLTFLEARLGQKNPRSAIGLTANNHLLMVAVDGRQAGLSAGMTFTELARLMLELGAVDAMALDGGGSTTLWAGNSVVNSPSARKERNITNAILVISQIPVFIDGQRVYFSTPPIIEKGRTLVPLRELFERLDTTVDWDPNTRTITATRAGTFIEMSPDRQQALINGTEVTLDVPPIIINGRVLVPLRFVSTALGSVVDWDPQLETIYINRN